MQFRQAKGFNLIELMVVVSIVAILTILAIPSFSQWIQNSRMRSVAESWENGLRFAQGEAARLNRVTTFTPSGTGWTVSYTQTSGDPATASGCASAASNCLQQDAGAGGSTTTITPATTISFNSFGRVGTAGSFGSTTGNTSFTLAGANTTYLITSSLVGTRRLQIIVSPAGKIRTCDPDKALSATTPDGC